MVKITRNCGLNFNILDPWRLGTFTPSFDGWRMTIHLSGLLICQIFCYYRHLPGPNEDESWWEFKLSLSFGLKLSCALIEFVPAQIFHESRREFSLVWPTLHDSRWELKKKLSWEPTLILVWPGLSTYKYQKIVHSEYYYFVFSGSSGIVRPSGRLDYESMADKFYILNISATDNGDPQFTSYAVLNITVTDFNDNQPKFSQTSYNLGVSEDAAVDTYFDQITATDADTEQNAKVMHGLYERFTINSISSHCPKCLLWERASVFLRRGLSVRTFFRALQ